MQKKYQVFLSSTFRDLIEQREALIKVCLRMGHMPVGMEMFNPADEEQWKVITRAIENSDYYCIIVAHRYGSMVKNVSYTEKEYSYAMKIGVPAIRFMLRGNAPWPSEHTEDGEPARSLLKKFKLRLMKKPVGFWSTTEELQASFAIAFPEAINIHPRPGWVRVADGELDNMLSELSRLSHENAQYRKEIDSLKNSPDFNNHDKNILAKINRDMTVVVHRHGEEGASLSTFTLNVNCAWLLNACAPHFAIGVREQIVDRVICNALNLDPQKDRTTVDGTSTYLFLTNMTMRGILRVNFFTERKEKLDLRSLMPVFHDSGSGSGRTRLAEDRTTRSYILTDLGSRVVQQIETLVENNFINRPSVSIKSQDGRSS
jgi:hypothetical protein